MMNHIQDLNTGEVQVTVFCPKPATADQVREQLGSKFRVETISAGLKRMSLDSGFDQLEIQRKSELLFELWIAWKKIGLPNSFQLFNNSFNLVTELRGYSTNTEMLTELLLKHNKEVYEGVVFILRYYKERNLFDENTMYENLAKSEIKINENEIIFLWGFKHLSANQLDMLSNFSNITDVYIPLPLKIREKLSFSDWPQWLLENSESIELESNQSELLPSVICADKFLTAKKMNEWLAESENGSIYFWDQQELEKSIHEINSSLINFKDSVDLFSEELSKLKTKFHQNDFNEIPVVLENLETLYQKEEKLRPKNYRLLKVLYELHENFKSLSVFGISDISLEDIKIIFEKTRLDLPRNSLINIAESSKGQVGTFESAVLEKNVQKLFIMGESIGLDFQNNADEELLSDLASLGPIRNPELDAEFNFSYLLNSLNNDSTIILHPSIFEKTETLNHLKILQGKDTGLRKIIKDNIDYKINISEEELKQIAHVSPNRLQKYINCPLSYYYGYYDRLSSVGEIHSDFDGREIGNIGHHVLAEILPKLLKGASYPTVEETLKSELEKMPKELFLSYRDKEIYMSLEKNINLVVNEFKKLSVKTIKEVHTERKYTNETYQGTLDLVIEFVDGTVFIIDFKKSSSGIPSQKDFRNGDVIQLSLYSLFFNEAPNIIMGYICFENLKESLIFYQGDCDISKELIQVEFADKVAWKLNKDNVLPDVHLKIEQMTTEMKRQTEFIPAPRSSNTCKYCEAKEFCPRGGSDES